MVLNYLPMNLQVVSRGLGGLEFCGSGNLPIKHLVGRMVHPHDDSGTFIFSRHILQATVDNLHNPMKTLSLYTLQPPRAQVFGVLNLVVAAAWSNIGPKLALSHLNPKPSVGNPKPNPPPPPQGSEPC